MSGKGTIVFKGLSVQTIITIFLGILEIIVFSIMSRLLSKEDFGYFAVLTGVFTIVFCISEAGMGASIIQKNDATKEHTNTAFTLSCLLGFVFSVIMFIGAGPLSILIADESLVIPMRIMAVGIFFSSVLSVGKSLMQKDLRFKQLGVFNIVAYISSSIVGIFMAWLGCGVYSIVIMYVLNVFLYAILIYLFGTKLPSFAFDKTESKRIFSFGGWLTAGVILNTISRQLDKLMLSRLLSVQTLGCYNRPAGFVSSIESKINGILDTVLFPILSSIQNDRSKVQSAYLKTFSLINSFSMILAFAFFINASLIMRVFLGEQWVEYSDIMRIISISVIFNIDNRIVDCFFRSLNYVKYNFYIRLFSLFYTMLGIIIGVKFGIYGVALSLVITNVSIIIIKMLTLNKLVEVPLIDLLKKWIASFKSFPIFCLIYFISLILNSYGIGGEISSLMLFGLCTFAMVIFFPKCISKSFVQNVYPHIKKYVSKFTPK